MVDWLTNSSETYFAMISDNNLGKIVGKLSGGNPTCYGDTLFFQLKNSKIRYTISHKKMRRPNNTLYEVDALYPDHRTDYTLDDYQQKRDLEVERALKLTKGSES